MPAEAGGGEMISAEDCEAIERGKSHCYINANRLECAKCGGEYKLHLPLELWVVEALSWGFCKEHADCEEKE